MNNIYRIIGVFFLALLLIPLFALVSAIPLYFLWNWLMPTIFGFKIITFWQAFGLTFLTALLFKSPVIRNK